MNINSSNRKSFKLQRSGLKRLQAILKRLSTGADEDGTPNISFANFDNALCFENLLEVVFQEV